MGTTDNNAGYVISPEDQLQNELKSYGISPQDRRQNFSMLETASASHSDDGGKYEAAVLPYRPSTESDTGSVNFTDSLMVVGKQLPSGRAAAALDLFARENVGLFVNYVAVGAVHGLFQSLMYPYLNVYLNMDDYLAYSAERWLALPWLLKVFLAMLSDGVPIKGSRRRAYMLIGWGICFFFSFILAVLPSETPYLTNGAVANSIASESGNKYVAMFVIATFGYVLADTASDGMLVEFAQLHQASEQQQMQFHHQQRELEGDTNPLPMPPPRASGPTYVVTTLFAARYFAQFVVTFFVAFMCNSDSYGGSFAWGASVNGMVVIAVLVSAGTMVVTWFFLLEDENPAGYNIHILMPREWRITAHKVFHQRAIVQLMAYIFLSRLCFTYYATSAKAIYQYWAPAGTLMTNIFSSLNAVVYAGAALLIGHGPTTHILQKLGWRQTVAGSVVISAALTLVVALFAVYNVVRVAVLTLLVEQVIVVFEALAYFVALFAAVAVAEPGLECTSFSLLVTMGNLAVPFTISLSQAIGEHFDVYDSEYESDSSHARAQAMYCFLVAVVIRALHLVVLPLLPDQAEAARALKLARFTGRKGSVVAIAAAVCASFMVFWALLTTTLSSFERTSCLNVAGGEGC
ncbi:Transmembrane protein [Phytophthora cinnamomi]|uniref:Transmembrane protein n=1 Tax=Phytophthora cinnamomi TaxID=4785 RepID=UPI003559CF50|nr:Transmembrane protein [Phytophthora cinnamomi]